MIRERDELPDTPINEYARSKRRAEAVVGASKTRHLILRPRAIFGPDDTVLFPRILRAARSGALPHITREDGRPTMADLIYIDNLTHMIARALERQSEGVYNLTNAEPVDTFDFLARIFAELGYPPITKSIPSRWAFRLARGLEALSACTANRWEPPLTRFGVEVMVHSKTFDVSKAMADFGPPPVPLEEARRGFVSWQRTQDDRHR
jgi:2-alkyl-3-oxoalkanoate reductase